MVRIKNIHEKPSPADGERIYVDPIWSNGADTEFVKISDWNKDVAPSYDLWRFHYRPDKWDDYIKLYKEQLKQPEKQRALQALFQKTRNGTITLVYGNGDEHHNNAIVLKQVLEEMASPKKAA